MISYSEQNLHRYNKQTVTSFITALDCGTTYAPEGFLYKHRFLEVFELLYVTKGKLYLEYDHKPLTLGAHQSIIIPPFKSVKGLSACDETTVFYYVDFMTDHRESFDIHTATVNLDKPARFEDTLERLSFCFKRTAIKDYTRDAYLLTLFDELSSANTDADSTSLLAYKVSAYIEQNLSTPLTVQQIADALSYNRDYLCRAVKRFYGIPLKDYVVSQKISAAKRLLATSSFSITDIAEYIGFSDPNRFTKFFKYHVNLSPSQYKNQVQ